MIFLMAKLRVINKMPSLFPTYYKLSFLFLIVLMLASCSGGELTVKEKDIKIAPPVIEDIVIAETITDSLIVGNKIIPIIINDKIVNDTTIVVKYFPLEKYFYLKVKPDTLIFRDIDTVQQVRYIKESFFNKLGWGFIGVVVIVIFLIIVFIRIKK